MIEQEIHDKYIRLFEELTAIIEETYARIIRSEPDLFFKENINFFAKSFLVSICVYLESYLKDIAFSHINSVNEKLSIAAVPNNLIHWHIIHPKDIDKKDFRFENLRISIKKKDLDEYISGNPDRTAILFKRIGIDITVIEGFSGRRELIHSIVGKRNNVVHHNDDANDVSKVDLILYISTFIEYMELITQLIKTENYK